MKLRVLSVDFNLEGQGIKNVSFWKAPSLSDYDVVIIDPKQISDIWANSIGPKMMGLYGAIAYMIKVSVTI